MENQKNNTGLIVLVIVLFLLVLGLGGYIVYDKVLSNKETPVNEPTNNVPSNNDVVEEQLPEWAEYLLKQNINSIVVNNRTCTMDDDGMHESSEQLTVDQLRKVLVEVTKSKLTKYKDIGGFGGPCIRNIKVKYNDTKEFELFLYKYIDIERTDSEIISLLEKENYTNVESRTNTPVPENPQSMFEYDWDGAYLDTLLG